MQRELESLLLERSKFVFQPLRPGAPRLTLDLIADTTISVNGGPHHGMWLKSGSEILELTFHYLGQNDRAKTTEMIRIHGTDTWLAKGDWGAVLAPLACGADQQQVADDAQHVLILPRTSVRQPFAKLGCVLR